MKSFFEQELLIALGSNLGSQGRGRAATLRAALVSLRAAGLRIRRISRFYETPCFPAGAGSDYVNACAVLDGAQDARAALDIMHSVEEAFGRKREQRWASRTLDLDLLALGDQVLPDAVTQAHWRNLPGADQSRMMPDQLILPHPRLQDRAFVLIPLNDIAPDWTHPELQLTVAQMAADLPGEDRDAVIAL